MIVIARSFISDHYKFNMHALHGVREMVCKNNTWPVKQ